MRTIASVTSRTLASANAAAAATPAAQPGGPLPFPVSSLAPWKTSSATDAASAKPARLNAAFTGRRRRTTTSAIPAPQS